MREKTKNIVQQKDAELNRGDEKGFISSDLIQAWGIAAIFIEVLDDIAAALEKLAKRACEECGQVDIGQTGEYPCEKCGLPTVWDRKE